MKKRGLNFKSKDVCSCIGMINALRVKLWMFGE
jgi:hypothetical protein